MLKSVVLSDDVFFFSNLINNMLPCEMCEYFVLIDVQRVLKIIKLTDN